MSIEQTIEVTIRSREEQGAGVVVLELVSSDGSALPSFEAGAHIDVQINSELVRQYSLCSDPAQSGFYRIGVLKDPNSRGGSEAVFDTFEVGRTIDISGPRNHFPLENQAKKSVLAGGGIGITPMIAMAYTLEREGKEFELHYCTRTQGAGAFEQELKQHFAEKVIFHYDDQADSQRFSPQQVLADAEPDTHLYVCGPTGFMDWVIESAKGTGLSAEQIHFEYFNAEVEMEGDAFEVYCEQSDITVQVESGISIAQSLKSAGVRVAVSCESGVCGTCITDVLEGVPDHRDQFLTDEEKEDNDQIALCCSRARSSRLVIDI